MERFLPAFHDAIRTDYPHRDDFMLQQMRVDFGPNGLNLKQIPLPIWQFASPDRKLGVGLTPDALTLHTISYQDHQTFIKEYEIALAKLVSIPDIGIAWTNSVGMRYVDLITTKDDERLDQLLKPSVLPPPFTDVSNLKIHEGVYAAKYRTPKAEIRFQIFRNPLTVLPPDLNTPLVQSNNWHMIRPSAEFAVVDTDCSVVFVDSIPMDVRTVCDHMYDLRFVAKSIFLKIGTPYAEKLWKGEV